MPTIPEIKAELKALGVKGITGKNKAELVAMLEQAKAPKEAPKKKGPKIAPKKPEIGDVSEPPIIAPKRKPEIGDVSEPPKEAPKKKGPRIAPKKPEIGEDGLAELLGIIAKSVAEPAPAPAPATAPHETEEGEALQSFGHFIWRRFDSGDTKGMKKNIRRTAGGMFPMYAMDLVKVKDRFPTYWEEWNPIIGLMIPGASGKARATCNPDGTVSFTNIVLEGEASHSAINDVIKHEFQSYGAGDLQPRYKKIAEALTSMRVYNKGKKSQGEKKPSKEEIEDFVRSEIARLDLPKKETQADIYQDNLRRAREKEEKIESADEELKQLMAEALEASKEGGKFKRRENWKGKAGYMKKRDKLWEKYPAGIDRFRRAIPFNFGWSPKEQSGNSHAHEMYQRHGINID